MHENIGDASQRQGCAGELGKENGSTTSDAVERRTRNTIRRTEKHQLDCAEKTQYSET